MIDSGQRNTNPRAPRRGPQHSRPGAAAARRRRAAQHQQDVHHSSAAAAAAAAPASPTGGATSHTEATPSSAIQCRPSSSNNSPNTSTQQESSDGDSNTNDSNERNRPNDTQAWFDRSNENPSTTLDNSAMDVDPPFFQDPSAGSNDGGPADPIPHELLPAHRAAERAEDAPQDSKTSSTQDYRSVIDDLTVEIKRLRDELKRYRHVGPDTLRRQKLFEIKFHGLPQWKKQELEATLRDFTAGLNRESSTEPSSSKRKKSSRNTSRLQAGSSSASKHPSSSSESHLRPVDSAYHSMSIGNRSAGNSELPQSKRESSQATDRKVEDYLKDIPEGLYPRHITMSDKQKKKLVVRRLEQLFTGKSGKSRERKENQENQEKQEKQEEPPAAAAGDDGLSREARILPTTNPKGKVAAPGATGSAATQSGTNVTSQSNTDLTSWSGNKSGPNDNASGGAGSGGRSGAASGSGGSNPSPNENHPFEQRPTHPKDLDPDRMPDPSENMEYLRHLGVTPAPDPAKATPSGTSPGGVSTDSEGWVYLNLLSNLAQLHIFNVAPSFVRAAVAEKSSKFELSSDGRKIRWKGGNSGQGTRFSSDSEGMGSRGSTDDGESPDGSRKRVRISDSGEDGSADTLSSERNNSGSGLESFHYKPLFARGDSFAEQASQEDSSSSPGSGGDSYNNGSGWGNSHSASSRRRKRRLDGAIIYYSGAPFCTDLSGDPGYQSPTTYMASNDGGEGAEEQASESGPAERDSGRVTISGSSLAYRPLSAVKGKEADSASAMDTSSDAAVNDLEVIEDSDGEDIKAEFPWSESRQKQRGTFLALEPCGLGGVLPEDNFIMTVTTKRAKDEARADASTEEALAEAKGRSALEKLASKAPYSAAKKHARPSPPLGIEYVSGRIKRLRPATLPPPAVFLPPFSSDESSGWGDDAEDEDDEEGLSSGNEGSSSRRVNPHHSEHSDGDETSGSMEDDEASVARAASVEVEVEEESARMARSARSGRLSGSGRGGRAARRGSLAATAGCASSGYSSSMEEGL